MVSKHFPSLVSNFPFFRIQKDSIDPEKLKVTLGDDQLNNTCDMKRAMELVALAQFKDLNTNLGSIAEYECMIYLLPKHFFRVKTKHPRNWP